MFRKCLIIVCSACVMWFGAGTGFGITTCAGQVGDNFPELSGITVQENSVTLPEDTKGKFTLLGMAYSKKAETDLESWYQPVFEQFIQPKINPGPFSAFAYDVNLYFVPMFTGVKAAATGKARKQTLKKVDERLHPYILFYKGSLKTYKESLSFEAKDVPYFFVLDSEGKIVHAVSGAYSDEKMEAIQTILDSEE